jgi:putative peptidoglycan lipid II flippase
MCFAIPSAVGMALISHLLIEVLFQRGRFTTMDTMETARVVQFYSFGLIGYAALKVIVPAFYALGQAKKPMLVSFLAIGVNLMLCMLFTRVGPLDFGLFDLGARGLALATSCAAVLNSLILLGMLRNLLEKRMDFRETLAGLGKVGLASLIMGAGVYGARHLFVTINLPNILWISILQVAVLVVLGALIFLAAARFLNVREAREMTDLILRKLHINKN